MKRYFITLSLLAVAMAAMAQLTARTAFAEAPSSVFPLLDKLTRLDMIDYFEAGSKVESVNALEGVSAVTSLSDESLTVHLTDASDVQIFVVPTAKSDTIIGVITTVATPGHDSSLALYSGRWKRLDGLFTAPKLADWLTDPRHSAEVEIVVPFMLTSYVYNPADKTLSLTNNLKGFLSDDIYSMVDGLVRQSLVYRWDGNRFVRQK